MEPLEIAVKMEIEGKEFYQRASEKSADVLGKELFARLAEEEDRHAETARRIYDALRRGQDTSSIDISFDQGAALKSIFAKATKEIEQDRQVGHSELEAIQTALDMEEKSRKFYEEHSSKASDDLEKRFFGALTAEERGHYIALIDYKEYLTDPVGYFAKSEHISLDGG